MLKINKVILYQCPLYDGVNTYEIQGKFLHKKTFYRHGNVNNTEIEAYDNSKVQVPSKEITDILKNWNLHTIYKGLFKLRHDHEKSTSSVYVDCNKHTKYECDSRKILKDLNDVFTVFQSTRKMLGISEFEYKKYGFPPIQLLLTAALCNNHERTMSLLNNYSTRSILNTINSSKFKHIFKLVHPSTTFIYSDSI